MLTHIEVCCTFEVMKRILLFALIVQVFFFSCSVKQEMEININSAGTVKLHIELHPIFRDYLIDISDIFIENTGEEILFDISKIKSTLAVRKGLTLISVDTPKPNILDLEVRFENVTDIITEREAGETDNVLMLKKEGNVNVLDFHLTASNFRSVLGIAALEDSPMVDTFGPSATAPWNKEEYLENIIYALEENAAEEEIIEMFEKARIDVVVNVDAKIVSQKGGKIKGNSVIFSIPVLRVLTLETPLDFQIKYK